MCGSGVRFPWNNNAALDEKIQLHPKMHIPGHFRHPFGVLTMLISARKIHRDLLPDMHHKQF
jgi:hypothetical protein